MPTLTNCVHMHALQMDILCVYPSIGSTVTVPTSARGLVIMSLIDICLSSHLLAYFCTDWRLDFSSPDNFIKAVMVRQSDWQTETKECRRERWNQNHMDMNDLDCNGYKCHFLLENSDAKTPNLSFTRSQPCQKIHQCSFAIKIFIIEQKLRCLHSLLPPQQSYMFSAYYSSSVYSNVFKWEMFRSTLCWQNSLMLRAAQRRATAAQLISITTILRT